MPRSAFNARDELASYDSPLVHPPHSTPARPATLDDADCSVTWACPHCGFKQKSLIDYDAPFAHPDHAVCVMCESRFEAWVQVLTQEEWCRVQKWMARDAAKQAVLTARKKSSGGLWSKLNSGDEALRKNITAILLNSSPKDLKRFGVDIGGTCHLEAREGGEFAEVSKDGVELNRFRLNL